jgi:antirestriction protein ArdC
MGWYRVVKTIKGHRYTYEQRTWREGNRVRTESRYVGRALDEPTAGVNTTTPRSLNSSAFVEEAFAGLTKPYPLPHLWTHGWTAEPKQESAVERVAELDEFLARLQFTQTSSTDAAYYQRSTDTINIPPEECFFAVDEETATQSYYGTLLHELGHWTGHPTRLGRRMQVPDREIYAREELVAEASAMILERYFKLAPANLRRHAHYFQIWLSRTADQAQALAYARREAKRGVDFLLR